MTAWFDEMLHSGIGQRLSMDQVLFREKTDLQDLVIFENRLFGRVLALDGIIQTTERDEFVYHEMLSHVPILAHGAVQHVLIIGGGDGGMAREVLQHRRVATLTMVEIDPSVIALCRRHLPAISAGAFEDQRMTLVIGDGAAFVAAQEARWDVIIVDSSDPCGPNEVLFGEAFYRDCRKCLAPGGILVTQNGVPWLQGEELTDSYRRLSGQFADVWFFLAAVPTYQGGHMAFGWASERCEIRTTPFETIAARYHEAAITTRYYTPEVHVAAFALPAFVHALMA